MRCITCENLSLKAICKTCQTNLLKPSFYKRELEDGFFVFSFYRYEDIKELLNAKYQFYGDRIYNILAKLSFKKFAKNFEFDSQLTAIPIDDHTRHEFSQSAILTFHLKSKYLKPKYAKLKATNIIKYAGKSLEFRQKNKRDFRYTGKQNLKVVIVDDLITTGLTILEAKETLEKNNCEVLFALTLSDARI
jgi:competence protein ComFC